MSSIPGHVYDAATRRAHYRGVHPMFIAAARAGTNALCVDCRKASLGGGLRCLDCFTATVARRRLHAVSIRGGQAARRDDARRDGEALRVDEHGDAAGPANPCRGAAGSTPRLVKETS